MADSSGTPVYARAVAVDDSGAVLLDDEPSGTSRGRRAVHVFNNNELAGDTLYVGGAGVDAATGYPILAIESERFYLRDGQELYGICDATETVDARVVTVQGD